MKKVLSLISLSFFIQFLYAQNLQNDTALIRSLRMASNKAIANHDIAQMSSFWLNDLVLVRGNSTHLTGKDAITAEWKKLFTDNPKVLYIRTPTQITISHNDTLAWETGTWKAFNSYSNGGNYSAMWKRSNNTWKILAELFVSLY
ncbi:MAG: nuclear transport factor 2 family protein [Chitinophagaceae bacterium]|nr:nuclear transport factor 2 family protein [Chitinophagaceae bacterium]